MLAERSPRSGDLLLDPTPPQNRQIWSPQIYSVQNVCIQSSPVEFSYVFSVAFHFKISFFEITKKKTLSLKNVFQQSKSKIPRYTQRPPTITYISGVKTTNILLRLYIQNQDVDLLTPSKRSILHRRFLCQLLHTSPAVAHVLPDASLLCSSTISMSYWWDSPPPQE